jgi:hypothetical protein
MICIIIVIIASQPSEHESPQQVDVPLMWADTSKPERLLANRSQNPAGGSAEENCIVVSSHRSKLLPLAFSSSDCILTTTSSSEFGRSIILYLER